MWTVGGFDLNAHVFGLENLTRACPVIVYETEESSTPQIHYFAQVCANISRLKMAAIAPAMPIFKVSESERQNTGILWLDSYWGFSLLLQTIFISNRFFTFFWINEAEFCSSVLNWPTAGSSHPAFPNDCHVSKTFLVETQEHFHPTWWSNSFLRCCIARHLYSEGATWNGSTTVIQPTSWWYEQWPKELAPLGYYGTLHADILHIPQPGAWTGQ